MWWQLEFEVLAVHGEDASALLIDQGATGVEIVGHHTDGTLAPPHAAGGETIAVADGHVRLVGSYPGAWQRPEVLQSARQALEMMGLSPALDNAVLIARDDEDWASSWKAHFKPLRVGERIWVVPTWIEVPEVGAEAIILRIDPGMAFGTGHHESTSLCLAAMEHTLARDRPASMLDVGCGSGILAIAAAKLGVARLRGTDIDPEAVRIAAENIADNELQNSVQVCTTPVNALSERFDWVVANILASELCRLAPAIIGRVQPTGGTILLSGILAEQAEDVERAYVAAAQAAGRADIERLDMPQQQDWVALLYRLGPLAKTAS